MNENVVLPKHSLYSATLIAVLPVVSNHISDSDSLFTKFYKDYGGDNDTEITPNTNPYSKSINQSNIYYLLIYNQSIK